MHRRRGARDASHWRWGCQPGDSRCAVAAANILAGPLRDGTLCTNHLAKVQRRREFATKVTQKVQAIMRRQIAGDPENMDRERSPGRAPDGIHVTPGADAHSLYKPWSSARACENT